MDTENQAFKILNVRTKISLRVLLIYYHLFLSTFTHWTVEPKLSICKCNGKINSIFPSCAQNNIERSSLGKNEFFVGNAINHRCKSVQRISSSKMAREIYVFITCRCLACFRYTSVTKYTGKWNVGVGVTIFQERGRWISCEAFMTQFQPTTFIMTCKSGVGDHGFHATRRTTWNRAPLCLSLFNRCHVCLSVPLLLFDRKHVYRVSKKKGSQHFEGSFVDVSIENWPIF